jgi:hypothetical protein
MASGKIAVTVCDADMMWHASKMGNACECVPVGCGNGVMDPGEACDPKLALPATATCSTLMPGTMGSVSCNPMTCTVNVTLCMPSVTTGNGTGGGGGTSGM